MLITNRENKTPTHSYHLFLDEAGDSTFYGKGKIPIVGQEGASKSFLLGMARFNQPLSLIRDQVKTLQQQVSSDPYFQDISSINKKVRKHGYFFHAKDDIPEVRKKFYDFLVQLDCQFEVVVGRKIPSLFERKHNGRETEFYADLLSHLIQNQIGEHSKIVLNIADRQKATKNQNLQFALNKALTRYQREHGQYPEIEVQFNIQNQLTEPILNITDYFCWAVQRLLERGEIRFYNFVKSKIVKVTDIYADEGLKIYTPENPLTQAHIL